MTKVKFLYCFLVIFFCISNLLSEETMINENWIKSQLTSRKIIKEKGNKNDLTIQDSDFMNKIEKLNFENLEIPISIYLREIIFEEKKKFDITNIDRAFDILQNKFNNKIFFIDFSNDISHSNITKEPFIIKNILEGYVRIMDDYSDKIFIDFIRIKKIIDYFVKRKNLDGSEFVITSYISFIRKYIMLVSSEKIQDKHRNLMIKICEDLNLNSSKTDIEKYIGGQELKAEYYYYNEKSFKK